MRSLHTRLTYPLHLVLFASLVLLSSCDNGRSPGDDDDVTDDDDDAAPDADPVAELTELSDGECPDMDTSGISSFSSGGINRKVAVLFPEDLEQGMPLVFNFHGLTNVGTDPVENSMGQMQALANANNAVVIMPEARAISLPLVGELLCWGILDDAAADLTLFDDLRTCAANELGVDLKKVSTWGHSGGALWSSVMLMERSTSLAAVVEFSGGADFSIPAVGGPFVSYSSPERQVPVLLSSGGSEDSWPQGFAIISFETTTDTLEAGLVADGHRVVRCRHQQGHYAIPSDLWAFSNRWNLEHHFSEESPFGDNDLPDGCEFVEN